MQWPLRWPFRNRGSEAGASGASAAVDGVVGSAGDIAGTAAAGSGAAAWTSLAPIQRSFGPLPLTAPSRRFSRQVSDSVAMPIALAPLGHARSADGPAGLVAGLANPVVARVAEPTHVPLHLAPQRAVAGQMASPGDATYGGLDGPEDAGVGTVGTGVTTSDSTGAVAADSLSPSVVETPAGSDPPAPPTVVLRTVAVIDRTATTPLVSRSLVSAAEPMGTTSAGAATSAGPATSSNVATSASVPGDVASNGDGAQGFAHPAGDRIPAPGNGPSASPRSVQRMTEGASGQGSTEVQQGPRLTIGQVRRLGLGAPFGGWPSSGSPTVSRSPDPEGGPSESSLSPRPAPPTGSDAPARTAGNQPSDVGHVAPATDHVVARAFDSQPSATGGAAAAGGDASIGQAGGPASSPDASSVAAASPPVRGDMPQGLDELAARTADDVVVAREALPNPPAAIAQGHRSGRALQRTATTRTGLGAPLVGATPPFTVARMPLDPSARPLVSAEHAAGGPPSPVSLNDTSDPQPAPSQANDVDPDHVGAEYSHPRIDAQRYSSAAGTAVDVGILDLLSTAPPHGSVAAEHFSQRAPLVARASAGDPVASPLRATAQPAVAPIVSRSPLRPTGERAIGPVLAREPMPGIVQRQTDHSASSPSTPAASRAAEIGSGAPVGLQPGAPIAFERRPDTFQRTADLPLARLAIGANESPRGDHAAVANGIAPGSDAIDTASPSDDAASLAVARLATAPTSSPPSWEPSIQRADAPAPAAASGAAPAAGSIPTGDRELDELSRRLYDRIRSRLRLELLVDRERSGLLSDLG